MELELCRPSVQTSENPPPVTLGKNANPNTALLIPESYLNHPLGDQNTLKNCLIHYLLSLAVLGDALKHFLTHQYHKFDALIGNNSCYANAYTIFRISQHMNNSPEMKTQLLITLQEIERAKNKTSNLLEHLHNDFSAFAKDFHDFLSVNGLIVDLPRDFIILGLAFGCTASKLKTAQEIEEIHYDSFLTEYQNKLERVLAKKSIIKLIKHWQKLLATLNVSTLQEHARFTSPKTRPWSKYLFGEYVLMDERNRPCLPSFYASKAIFDLLLSRPFSMIGLQVNVIAQPGTYLDRFTLFYEVQPDRSLRIIEAKNVSLEQPIYMFVGCRYIPQPVVDIRALKAEFTQRSLEEIIFAHEVTYPQYPKALKAKNILPDEPALRKELHRLQRMKGFSLEDPSDLCLTHIFVDDIRSQASSTNRFPVYLPKLGHHEGNDEACSKTHKRRIML